MRNLRIISINHQTHDADERIKLNPTETGWNQLFSFMDYNLHLEGYVLLRTCNRIELYYEAEVNWNTQIIDKWTSLMNSVSEVDFDQFQFFSGYRDSVEHLLNLSAGFKSAIYGDDQILSQLKKAFEEARARKSMSTLLERAYQSIMRFHKRICKETNFKSQTVSLAYQALKSARFRFGTEKLENKHVLIVGAGAMAAQIVKYLPKFRFGSVSITNRTQIRAEQLASNAKLSVVPYDQLNIQDYDIVISCTDQGYSLISDWPAIEYYVDLSLHSANLPQIPTSHILLSELQELINERNQIRMRSVGEVHMILAAMADEYEEWCVSWSVRAAGNVEV